MAYQTLKKRLDGGVRHAGAVRELRRGDDRESKDDKHG
jgi:hypothetical protein